MASSNSVPDDPMAAPSCGGQEVGQPTEDDPEKLELINSFCRNWRLATDDNRLTLFGFRRFRTIHLLNLRFIEDEIGKIDHKIFQAGLKLGFLPTTTDRLGLKHSKIDPNGPRSEEIINRKLVLQLRDLLKQYDEGLASFNQIMMMETFALADCSWQASLRDDLNPYETYKTRLVRVNLAPRSGSRDPIQYGLRKYLRAFWFFVRSGRANENNQDPGADPSELESRLKRSYQNTSHLADIATRFLVALMTGVFLVGPLAILSRQSSNTAHLITVSVCIMIFSFLVSLLSRASNQETMMASAAYAAVLAVFVSSSVGSKCIQA